jgi:hypothetical protein
LAEQFGQREQAAGLQDGRWQARGRQGRRGGPVGPLARHREGAAVGAAQEEEVAATDSFALKDRERLAFQRVEGMSNLC